MPASKKPKWDKLKVEDKQTLAGKNPGHKAPLKTDPTIDRNGDKKSG